VTVTDLAALVGYCGLACGVCENACPCEASPEHGDQDCHQRRCCLEQGLDGCWQCDTFPCDEGYFSGDEWRGLCIACVQRVREEGIAEFVGLAQANLDPNYGLYRFKSASEVRAALSGGPPVDQAASSGGR